MMCENCLTVQVNGQEEEGNLSSHLNAIKTQIHRDLFHFILTYFLSHHLKLLGRSPKMLSPLS